MDQFNAIVAALALGIFTTWLWWLSRVMAKTSSQISDLHRWHAPDSHGRQEWKNPDMAVLVDELKGLRKDIQAFTRQVELDRIKRESSHRQPRRAP